MTHEKIGGDLFSSGHVVGDDFFIQCAISQACGMPPEKKHNAGISSVQKELDV